jgi:hypothetical protein
MIYFDYLPLLASYIYAKIYIIWNLDFYTCNLIAKHVIFIFYGLFTAQGVLTVHIIGSSVRHGGKIISNSTFYSILRFYDNDDDYECESYSLFT